MISVAVRGRIDEVKAVLVKTVYRERLTSAGEMSDEGGTKQSKHRQYITPSLRFFLNHNGEVLSSQNLQGKELSECE